MVRSILTAAAFSVAASTSAAVIVADRAEYRRGDITADDTLIVNSGQVFLRGGVEVGRVELNQNGEVFVEDDSHVAEAVIDTNARGYGLYVRSGSHVGDVTIFDGGVHAQSGRIEVLNIAGGDDEFIELTFGAAGTIGSIEYGSSAGVFMPLNGYLWEVAGDWNDGSALLTGFPTAEVIATMTPPETGRVTLELPNYVRWSLRLIYAAGVARGGDYFYNMEPPGVVGQVGIEELNFVRNDFAKTGPRPGDVNYDDVVSIDDLNLVRNNFGSDGTHWWAPRRAIPEPAALRLLALGLFGLAARRGRSRC